MVFADTVDREALGSLRELGRGGQGTVYECPEYGGSAPWPLVFKEYHERVRPAEAGMRSIVMVRNRKLATDEQRAYLDERAAWPLQVVVDGTSRACGVIMRRIPDAFFQDIKLLHPPGEVEREPRSSEFLVASRQRCDAAGVPFPTPKARGVIITELCGLLSLLHAADVVYGDLNPNNVIFEADRRTGAVMLVDCDAVRMHGSAAVVKQFKYEDWTAPEGGASLRSDVYKFGLFVLRTIAPGTGRGSASEIDASWRERVRVVFGDLHGEILDLLTRSLSVDRSARPRMPEWLGVLSGTTLAVAPPIRPPDKPWVPPRRDNASDIRWIPFGGGADTA